MSLRGTSGLTLLEALISLTLLSIATALIYGSLNTALGSWSAGLASGRREQVARIVLERMMQQLKSLVPATRLEDRRPVAAFEAGEDFLRFVTKHAVGSSAPAAVSYSMEEGDGGRRLVYREFPWPDKDLFGNSDPVREETLPEIGALEIVLMEADGDDAAPPGEASPGRYPAAVRILLRTSGDDGGEGAGNGIVVPLPVQPKPEEFLLFPGGRPAA